ncbi:MAG: hypothetical protein P1U65_14865 [Minwuia sp.]|nr:hypothetical protein [Minwuia sp.]
MKLSRRHLLATAPALFLLGCDSMAILPDGPRVPEISFRHLPAIKFAVATIEVEQTFVPSAQPPHIEQQLPVTPAQVARNWSRDRLQAAGTEGIARVNIIDASVRDVALKTDTSVTGLLKTQQESRLEGRVEIRIDITNPKGTGFTTAIATRSQTLPEGLTLDQREQMQIDFVEALGQDMNRRLETEIRFNLTSFVIP